ncbi:MAG: hypothetical protein Q9209_003058 [Squamulea sp. 1 TL-2023]
MPPVLQTLKEPTSSYCQAKDDLILHPMPTCFQSVQVLHKVRPEASIVDCKGYKIRGIDTGPCGSRVVNESSIIAIICVVMICCVAGFLKFKHSSVKDGAEGDTQVGQRRDHSHQSGRRKKERQDHVLHCARNDGRRQRNLSARTITDLSGQQHQLREHLAEFLARHQSVLTQQRALDIQTSFDMSGLETPAAAHLGNRERDWEQYQLRSNQEIIAGLEIPRSVVCQMHSNTEANYSSSVARAQSSFETLPEYALEDPLNIEEQTPAYTQ